VAAGTALVLLLAGFFYLNRLQDQLRQANAQLSNLEARVAELEIANIQLQQRNETLQQQAQADQQLLLVIASADPDRTLQVSGTETDPDAGGTFYVHDDQGVLVLHGLAPLPADETYQLWLIPPANGAPLPAGLLEIDQEAPAWITVQIPANAQDFATVAVSVEPAGGSPAPTGPIVLLGENS
jgi:hypothetical protein